jgi:hypothetical protein
MAAVDLLVLLVALLVGLLLGGVLAWVPLLLRTGHPPRPQVGEWGAMPPPRGKARAVARPEPESREAALGALVALVGAGLVALLAARPAGTWGDALGRLPGGALTVSVASLAVAIAFAVPAWMGVRR